MQFKLPTLVALLALSAPLKVMAETATAAGASASTSASAVPDIKEVVKTTPAPAPEGRTLGLLLPLYYGLFGHLFGKGGYYNGGYVRSCGNCGGTNYYGDWNGYYGFYSYGKNIRYVNNYDGTYTLSIYGLYGGSNGGTMTVTGPGGAFVFTRYNQGYYCQINKYYNCVSKIY